ncbi:pyocin knob domain-containing protein [Superficieibacter sp. HKU1]|uniref:pyocin knob domain-containing protein n=1 Tax=Superficieibacter sp. HKU1 TaxID=3031919 RepID=UPI0023E2491F|nr:pyocin knob domain-containing protein [Superficieibacter sp. HKU1]WES67180.1 pyocin knob domain-containing protein [Superficieibacter sp. HKU1]
MATISDELAAGLTKILQLAQLDLQNQDKMFSSAQTDVTLTRADGSTFAASTWAKMMAATVGTIKQNGNLGTRLLNEVDGRNEGFWIQPASANATAARNYPEYVAGNLLVMQNAANGLAGCTQLYFPFNNQNVWVRTGNANASGIASWTTWQKLAFTNDPVFTGKVVFPNQIHIRDGKAKITSNTENSMTFTVGGNFDAIQLDGDGLYNNGRIDCVRGYASRKGVGQNSAVTGNLYSFGWESTAKMGLYVDSSTIGFLAMQSSSDRQLKKLIKYTPKKARLVALGELMQWATATFKFKARGDGLIPESDTKLGFIANDLKEVSPECVEGEGLAEGDELDPTKAFSLDTVAMMAKMTLAMQAMEDQIIDLQNTVNDLKTQLDSRQ